MIENNEMMMEETIPAESVEESTEEEFVLEFEEDEVTEEKNEAEEKPEEEKEPEQTQEEQTTPPEDMFPGEFELDGNARTVTMAEAPSLIQKGLLYGQLKDKYMAKLKDAYADPRIVFVDELAKAAGVEVSEYMAKTKMQKEYASLLETYGNLDAVPEAVMKMFTENAAASKEKAAAEFEARKKAEWEKQKAEEFESFRENHPEIKEIPKEAAQLVLEGHSLEGAWAMTELPKALQKIAELEKQNKILTQNNKNKQTKLPSARSNAAKEDDFVWDFE